MGLDDSIHLLFCVTLAWYIDPSPFEPVKFNQRNSICIPFEDEMIPSSFGSSLTIPVTDKPRVRLLSLPCVCID